MSDPPASFIHRFVPSTDRSAESLTLFLLHGTGGNEHDLLPLGRALAPSAALLSPRGSVLEHGMPRFFRRFAEGVFDTDDIRRRARELARFLDAAAATYGFDRKRVVAAGYSNGANIAAAMLLLHGAVFSGAVLFRPMTPLVPDPLPDLARTPILVLAGNGDPLVPVEETKRFVELLRRAAADVTLIALDQGHGISVDDVAEARNWLIQHFPAAVGR
ncbi:MAG: alpha/beta hydrolase [Roseiflexaceae bacterium]|nr:alpha/beta hydrolase [Roseiflexus sp.]MDW8213961.1 alpha/beta hydrolase [Roseiflexaceae bacterium]